MKKYLFLSITIFNALPLWLHVKMKILLQNQILI